MLRTIFLALLFALFAVPIARSEEAPSGQETDLDSMSKEEILASPRWQRAEQALEDWLSVQNLYSPEELAQLEQRCNARIDAMDAAQLRKYLRDAETKLDILLSPEVQQARDWVGSYMAVLALPKQEELRQQLPDVANMTAPQIEQAVRGFLEAQQKHGRQGAAETARRKADVTRGREENARYADAKNAQLQQRKQAKADRANERAREARRESLENARLQATKTPEWYRQRRGWFGGWGGWGYRR